MNETIEEDLASRLETYPMFAYIGRRLVRVPHKSLILVKEMDIHMLKRIYVVWPSSS
jgi:hypothetical protein